MWPTGGGYICRIFLLLCTSVSFHCNLIVSVACGYNVRGCCLSTHEQYLRWTRTYFICGCHLKESIKCLLRCRKGKTMLKYFKWNRKYASIELDNKWYSRIKGPWLSWVHGTWIYNYVCNQCILLKSTIGSSHCYDAKGIVNFLRISLHWALCIYQKVGIWNPEPYDYPRLHIH
jgi:hypothetical protein